MSIPTRPQQNENIAPLDKAGANEKIDDAIQSQAEQLTAETDTGFLDSFKTTTASVLNDISTLWNQSVDYVSTGKEGRDANEIATNVQVSKIQQNIQELRLQEEHQQEVQQRQEEEVKRQERIDKETAAKQKVADDMRAKVEAEAFARINISDYTTEEVDTMKERWEDPKTVKKIDKYNKRILESQRDLAKAEAKFATAKAAGDLGDRASAMDDILRNEKTILHYTLLLDGIGNSIQKSISYDRHSAIYDKEIARMAKLFPKSGKGGDEKVHTA